jgi:hypothetical protein
MCPLCRNRRRHKGSVLVEAIAAVVIMSVSLVMIMESFASARRAAIMDQEYSKALFLLRTHMAQTLADPAALTHAAADKSLPAPFDRYHASAAVHNLGAGFPQDLKEMELFISWNGKRTKHAVQASVYIPSAGHTTTHSYVIQ